MERTTSPRTWIAVVLAAFAAPVLYQALAPEETAASDTASRCPGAEWVVREAGLCLAHPYTRWERINDVAGVRLQTCRQHMVRLRDMGFYEDEAVKAVSWMESQERTLPEYWQTVVGKDFCRDAQYRGSRSLADGTPQGVSR